MNKLSLISVLCAGLILAACGTTEKKAPIEEKGAGTPAAVPTTTVPSGPQVETHGLAPGATDQAEPLAGTGTGITGVDAAGAAMLKDPNNILSKRIVYFDFDKFNIKPEFQDLISAHASFLKKYPGAHITLQGNADERGSREYNMALGQRRADSVRQAMSVLGVKPEQIETISYGEEKPAVEGHDESAWKMNRRTVIVYQGE
jgi:peptidoglycan-associated lipoprotein